MLLETVTVVAVVVEAPFVDAEVGSQGSRDEEGRASSHTRGAEEGDLDTCSKDELQLTLAEAGVEAAVELHFAVAVVVAAV